MKKCTNCGKTEENNNACICSNCGGKLQKMNGTICPYCSTEIETGMNFCPKCGASAPGFTAEVRAESQTSASKKKTAGIIALVVLLSVALVAVSVWGTLSYMSSREEAHTEDTSDDKKTDENKQDSETEISTSSETEAFAEPGSDLAKVKESGILKIGYTHFEPYNYLENGKLVGFDTELALAVCEKLGVEADFVEIYWDEKYSDLDEEKIDCIWNGMTISEEAKKHCAVSQPYVDVSQVLLIRSDDIDLYTDIESLKNKTVACEAGSSSEMALIDSGFAEDNIFYCATSSDAIYELISGQVDACVVNKEIASIFREENIESIAELCPEYYGIGYRKDSNLKEEIDKILKELISDGTIEALAEKYNVSAIL